ncbi:MAG: type III pantothenate kinase [Wenzhouxiangellaceae bacterium]
MPNDWLLELGHSRLKLGRRINGGLTAAEAVEAMELEQFGAWLAAQRPGPHDRFWLAAVPAPEVTAGVTDELARAGLAWTAVTTGSVALPVAASYPGMGVDRWLALQPLWARLRSSFCMVDCGTATTIDLVGAKGVHVGGWIMPGVDAARGGLLMRAPGLRRPSIDPETQLGPARDTAVAIERGLLLQQVGAIALARRAAADLPEFNRTAPLVLTGGAAARLQSFLDEARVEPDLVLQGLAMAVES